MKKRIFSFLLTVLMILNLLPISVLATDTTRDVLALGDSITAAYGLVNPDTECFVNRLDVDSVVNKAVNGNTADGILAQLADGTIGDSDLKAADIVTITCGGNDLIALLYDLMAQEYNLKHPNSPIRGDQITTIMSEGDLTQQVELLEIALALLDRENDAYFIGGSAFNAKLAEYLNNIQSICEHIHSVNPDAKIILETQYNPYVEFKGVTVRYLFITYDVDPLYSGMEDGVTRLNQGIRDRAQAAGYLVAETKKAFDEYTDGGDLYNAYLNVSGLKIDFSVDFHPTAEGHRVISQVFQAVIDGLTYRVSTAEAPGGTVTADKSAAKPGETVTLTVLPETGYGLESLTAVDGLGDPVDLAEPDDNGNCSFIMPVGNVTVTAAFQPLTYSITFDPGDGSDPWSITVPYGTILEEPAVADRDGWLFRGWYIGSDDGEITDAAYDFTAAVTANRNLHGKWTACTDLELEGLQVTDDGYLLIESVPEETAMVLLAAYEGKKLTGCQTISLQELPLEVEILVSGGELRLFFLKSTFAPVCDPIPVPSD